MFNNRIKSHRRKRMNWNIPFEIGTWILVFVIYLLLREQINSLGEKHGKNNN